MNRHEIEFLYGYNRWANAKMFEAAAALPLEDLEKDLSTSFRSLHGTLLHIVGAEWLWLERWRGISPLALPKDLPTLDALSKKLAEVQTGQQEFLAGLGAEDLEHKLTYTNLKGETWSYPLGYILQHVVNHSTYHRGQVIAQLRQLGAKGIGTDLLLYLDGGSQARESVGAPPVSILETIPILRIFDVEKAREFYVSFLGFHVDWEHRFDDKAPLYMQVSRGGLSLHLSEHHGDATAGSTIFVRMTGVEALHREISAKEYPYLRPSVERAPWHAKVMEVTDPFGNRIRFSEDLAGRET
jgi:uncharacterized damage-inducible protein DinB/catechol 2,3-dioxygenase-like lactoylglutathione lyase family enzyme